MKKLKRVTGFSIAVAIGAASFSPAPVHAGTGSPAAPAAESAEADGLKINDDGTFTITARSTAVGAKGAPAARIVCTGSFRGKPYDAPHPGASSRKKKINAHLSITCTGPGAGATVVKVTSRMTDGHRLGAASSRTGRGKARTGGDLACVKSKRAYHAKGVVSIKFPPRYVPPTAGGAVRSITKAFKKNGKGICVKP